MANNMQQHILLCWIHVSWTPCWMMWFKLFLFWSPRLRFSEYKLTQLKHACELYIVRTLFPTVTRVTTTVFYKQGHVMSDELAPYDSRTQMVNSTDMNSYCKQVEKISWKFTPGIQAEFYLSGYYEYPIIDCVYVKIAKRCYRISRALRSRNPSLWLMTLKIKKKSLRTNTEKQLGCCSYYSAKKWKNLESIDFGTL